MRLETFLRRILPLLSVPWDYAISSERITLCNLNALPGDCIVQSQALPGDYIMQYQALPGELHYSMQYQAFPGGLHYNIIPSAA